METCDSSSSRIVSPSSQPPVSIVLATYNRRDWLRLAMDSVLDQSYPNLELTRRSKHNEYKTYSCS